MQLAFALDYTQETESVMLTLTGQIRIPRKAQGRHHQGVLEEDYSRQERAGPPLRGVSVSRITAAETAFCINVNEIPWKQVKTTVTWLYTEDLDKLVDKLGMYFYLEALTISDKTQAVSNPSLWSQGPDRQRRNTACN